MVKSLIAINLIAIWDRVTKVEHGTWDPKIFVWDPGPGTPYFVSL